MKHSAEYAGRPAAPSPYVVMGKSETEKVRAAAANGLLVRAGLLGPAYANGYSAMPLIDIAAEFAELAGSDVRTRGRLEIVAAALSTSDFPNVLLNVATKAVLKGYDAAAETFPLFTSVGELNDFRSAERVGLGAFPSLDKLGDGGEYKHAAVDDRGEPIVLGTYGKRWHVSREAIIANDLSAIARAPLAMGRAAARTVGDLVFGVLTGNAAMSDGVALFHANHSNLATAGALSSATVDAMRSAMGSQKDKNGTRLNLRLKYLLVPLAMEGEAKAIRTSQRQVDGGEIGPGPNPVFETFDVIADGRLDADSMNAYYGLADPLAFDVIEVAYLNGIQTPVVEQHTPFRRDGFDYRVRIDVGVKALDWRTMQKNAGA